jgi:MoaA/NifB/PqqE/SkfB family radical SAM enzyme
MDDYNNKSICALPWVNLSTDTDGRLRLCCISDTYIKKDDGTTYNLGYDSIEDIINSNDYKKIRQDMIDGIPITGCTKCYSNEKNNGRSERQSHNKIWGHDIDFRKKYKQSINKENIDSTVQYVDLRFGNFCNLACRSCYGGASSQYNKEVKELQEIQPAILKFQNVFAEYNDWYTTDVFYENITKQLTNLKQYYCVGGEPTLIDKNYEILQKMVDSGESKHITLVLNTNMTNTKKDFYVFFQYFKRVLLMASIDGIYEMQEYLRYPSNWEKISSNLLKVVDMKLSNILIFVTPVIQKTNLSHLPKLFDYIEDINKKHNKLIIQIQPIVLIDPKYLDMKYLPTDYKIKCWEQIEEWIKNSCKYQNADFHQRMKTIKNSCFEEVDYQQNLTDYFEFTDIFDKNRNEKLSDINLEIASLRR